jgi:formamidopyrimidine-DNA glycosylase
MPELPEVEVLRRSLEPHLVGETICGVEVRETALRERVEAGKLRRGAVGRRIVGLSRRAKYLLADLEGGSTLVLHLGMSGRLTLADASAPRERHEHLAFHLASGRRLRLRDPRRFGLVLCLETSRLAADRHFARLGVEPLTPEFSGESLAVSARGRRGPVKSFLMDASVVVGVGNIYATEALHAAAMHPARSVARIARRRWSGLAEAVREVLGRAIEEGGTTLADFTDGLGESGMFQVSLAVYGREGEGCPRCGGTIRRLVQAGRSTFYCSRCQR